jgi:hypothetical protein
VLLRRENYRDAGSVRTPLAVFGRYVTILGCTEPVLACRETAKCKLPVAIDNNRLARYRCLGWSQCNLGPRYPVRRSRAYDRTFNGRRRRRLLGRGHLGQCQA